METHLTMFAMKSTDHVIILKLARGLDWVKYTVIDDGVDSELK